jgi:hypothetical protein
MSTFPMFDLCFVAAQVAFSFLRGGQDEGAFVEGGVDATRHELLLCT